jgi:hypothetical protein
VPRVHNVEISISTSQAVSVAGEARQAGKGRKKGWFHRFKVGKVPQRGHPGKYALIEWLMKRVGFGDLYSEKVIDADSGKVIHESHEPLSDHQGHGSDKFKK